MEDLEGRRICARLGSKAARSRKRPLSVSRRWRSTALCVARRSAVLARLLGLRFCGAPPPPALALFVLLALVAGAAPAPETGDF